jgi:hypothetical protein
MVNAALMVRCYDCGAAPMQGCNPACRNHIPGLHDLPPDEEEDE